jgi:hypothetical protein
MNAKMVRAAITICFCCCSPAGPQGQTNLPELRDIHIDGNRISDALAHVASVFQTVIGFENTEAPPFNKLLTIHLDRASLSETMNAVVQADDRYSWRKDTNGSISVFNKESRLALPDVVIGAFDANRLRRDEVVTALENSPEVRKWTEQHHCVVADRVIAFVGQTMNDTRTVSMSTRGKSLREILAEASQKMGTYAWAVQQYDKPNGCEIGIQLPRFYPPKHR